jgi:hypothetical protein
VLQSAAVPLTALAAVPLVPVTVTALPADHVTLGHFVAFDVHVDNQSGSTVAQLSIVNSIDSGAGTLSGVLTAGGTAASHTTCAQTGTFSCDAGNLAANETLDLRVIYKVTALGLFRVTFTGSSTGNTTSDPGGNSHGDTFIGSGEVTVSSEFDDGTNNDTKGYIPDGGDTLHTSLNNFGVNNPLWTEVAIPGNAVGLLGFLASVDEGAYPGVACGLRKGCYGQASHLVVNSGTALSAPFTVSILVNNAKSFTSLSQWQIVHVSDDGTTPQTLPACSSGVTMNCVLSKGYAPNDRTDYVATLVLDRNGYIRNG